MTTVTVDGGSAKLHQDAGLRLRRNDWERLTPGDRVSIHLDGNAAHSGLVDIVAPDASIFWVLLDEGRGRVAIHEGDDASVWLIEAE